MEAKQKHSAKESSGKIRKRLYSLISDSRLIKSVKFARHCTKMGVEAKVVLCLALFHVRIPLVHFRVPIVGLHLYIDVLGRCYEVSRNPNDEKCFRIAGDSEPKVLVRLGRF